MTRSGRRHARRCAQELFDDAVFQTVERDHCQPPAGRQQRLGRGQAGGQLIEFAIDVDAHSLKAARGRVFGHAGMPAKRAPHDIGKLTRGGQRTRRDDGPGNPARLAFFAIAIDHVGDFGLVGGVEKIGRTRPVAPHPHVERAVIGKRKAAFGLVELHRTDTDVKNHAIDLCQPGIAQRFTDFGKAVVVQHQQRIGTLRGWQQPPGANRIGIAIERMHARTASDQRQRIAARAKRPVGHRRARRRF